MTNDTQSQLAANKQALLKIRELKQQIADLQQQQSAVSEPIAIVSMACRFPKTSNTPEAFWQSLMDQTDEVSEIPDDRWDLPAFHDDDPEVPGKMYARHGVFLDQIDQMDPEFFGISPREATWVDPQQRLLMEVGWEALERAGWTPEAIGEHTGIFVGWMHNDYQNEASDSFLNLNPYIATGAAGSFLCGRLAYYLGLQGPSVAVDTACSSSLVALHLACQSLQQRDCDRALVGGVNAICSPTTNILTCKLKALSVTGQSRAFDAGADGYLRGEGCGVVTLRRLADAERDGDPILAVISGSAIGHNGFSSGLTAPNPKAQEKVIRQAVERAQLTPNDVSYLEAHGTGTELGDPIEMRAAATALAGTRSKDEPLLVGSVKTNIGHLEAAAGMAGLIKVLLSIQNDCLPGQLNFETPNPHIAWDTSPVKVLTETTAWPNAEHKVAGVSAFGMSGTNAHVVISEHSKTKASANPSAQGVPAATSSEPKPAANGVAELITLSGKSEQAVAELADRYRHYLKTNTAANLKDFAFTSNCRRSHFEYRAAVVANDAASAIDSLLAVSKGTSSDFVVSGQGRRAPKTAWQFTGQGSQYVNMAKGLYETDAVFAAAIDQCDSWLSQWRSESLIDVLFEEGEQDSAKINHTSWTQPAIFAVQMGLAKLLASRGLQPDVVWGHSVGQYAAACVAGMMSWEDGLKLIAERGRLIGELPAAGLMLAVFATLPDVEAVLQETELQEDAQQEGEVSDTVSIAALNGTHIVLSGQSAGITKLQQSFADRSLRCKVLTTSHAFHSSLMDPALQPFAEFASQVTFQAGSIPLVCNVTGKVLAADAVLDSDYWAKHIREAVRFSECIDTAVEIGCEVILELGPQGVLTRMAAANWTKPSDRLLTCIQKGTNDAESFLKAIGQLYAFGAAPDFQSLYGDQNCTQLLLPTYPFQRRRFWGPDKPRAAHAEHHTAHPLLGSHLKTPDASTTKRYETFVDADSPSWVVDHQVMDQVVMPGAGYLEMALAAGKENSVHDIVFAQPLQLSGRTSLQTIVNRPSASETTIESFSLASDQKAWTSHFSAKLSSVVERPDSRDLSAIKQRCVREIAAADFYSSMVDLGLQYGPSFQVIQSLHLSDDSVLAKLDAQVDVRGYLVPPPLLDGALHCLAAMLLKDSEQDLFLPVGIERLVLHSAISADLISEGIWCHASWGATEDSEDSGEQATAATNTDIRYADLELLSEAGEVLLSISRLKVKKLDRAAMRRMSGGGTQRLIYGLKHDSYVLPGQPVSGTNWLLVSDANDSTAAELQQLLTDGGQQVTRCRIGDSVDAMLKSLGEDQSFDGIAWLPNDDTQQNCSSLLNLIQGLKQNEVSGLPCGIAIVTRNGSHADLQSPNPLQTQYHGFARVLGAEHPEYRCRLIDFSTADSNSVTQVSQLLQVETAENEFVVANDEIVVARLARIRGKQTVDVFEDWGSRSVLITGGLGSLGQAAARWLVSKGVQHVVLISRRQPDEETSKQLQQIEALGCQVVVHSADVTSKAQMQSLVDEFGNSYPELGGVIHAAGILDDGRIVDQTWDRFAPVIATKIQGAALLDELTADMALRFFILYSSASSVFGTPGQSNYATGNAFLDGLAYQRCLNGKVATSINWGPWDTGMAASDQLRKRLALQGIRPLAIDEAHAAMEQILEQDVIQATVIDADWRRMQMGLGAEAPPLLSELAPARSASQMSDSAFVVQLKRLRGAAQTELLVKTVQDLLQTTLATTDAPDTDRPLIEMGLDSLMAVEFSTELQMILGEQIPIGPTMLFDHPTIDAIAAHVLEMVAAEDDVKDSASIAAPVEAAGVGKVTEREPIAIVGMSCRFPGAQNLDEFWDNILNGVDSVCEIPSDRWDIDRFYDANRAPGKMYTKQGGFLEDIGDFEPGFFNISEQEACWIDPQHRMLLENSYRALEHAGISPAPLADSNVGVFMGIMGQDYAFLPKLDDEEVIQGFQGAGLSHSAGVGRISYVFGFEGPSVAVDTASSSSLVALFQAVRSLQDHNCNMALAGGVNAILAPVNSLLMSKAGLLSADGRCKSFSAEADGFGRGEGCGVVVLKRLSDAEKDGDNVLAVVRGAAVVHNGFTSGITTPSGKSQARVITEALQDAGVAASQVQYLEAHGTGTELGDPMELGAAAAVYGKGRKRNQPLLVGSVKGNISHLEAAGGVSGLIKTVLSLHHGIIPPQANFDSPSAHIPWKRIPVKMVTETTEWPEAEERFAAVTALGLVGTNAHVVLSGAKSSQVADQQNADSDVSVEGTADTQDSTNQAGQLLVLSARDPQRLTEVAKSYLDWVESSESVDLAELCHSAAIGRRHYEHRAAFTVNGLKQLTDGLSMVAEGKTSDEIRSSKSQPKLAWVFSSFEADSTAEICLSMQQVYAAEPVFQKFIADLDERLAAHAELTKLPAIELKTWIQGESRTGDVDDLHLFALQAGLVHVWRSWGIEPDVVFGTGVGQYTAACVAGGLCFKDAAALIVQRQIALAAIATASSEDEAALADFEAFADTLNYYPPNMPLVCSLNAEVVAVHRTLGGSFWRQHVTDSASPDRWNCLATLNCDVIQQLGADSGSHAPEDICWGEKRPITLPVKFEKIDVVTSMKHTLGHLYMAGANPDFKTMNGQHVPKRISLPHYPFHKKRYWITEMSKHLPAT